MRLGVIPLAIELAQPPLGAGLDVGLRRDAPAPLTFKMAFTGLDKVLPK